jgi:hypothetical protein
MSTTTRTQPSATASSLSRMVARHPVTAFLLMAYAIGWTIFLPVVLSEEGIGLLPIRFPLTLVTSIASILALALPAFLDVPYEQANIHPFQGCRGETRVSVAS